ncbi:odorant receptor 46a-like [Venturia canescens]|uniref:odorant receptor 46a-like n=1 Tax=Venturia canescens TaxID=32260 RepID=UPI001C9D0AD8|nr:odorant receptor 46a-like [Venturia canescens]
MLLIHSWSFNMLQLWGLSRPRHWVSGWKKHSYNMLTIISIFCVWAFTLTGFMQIIMSPSFEEAAENSFVALTMFGVSCKMANWILRSDDISSVVDILNNDVCRPQGNEELAIQMKFDKLSRNNTMFFGGLTEGAVIAVTIGSFLENVSQRTLPFPAWLPFDYTSKWGFWIAFLHQIVAHGIGATIGGIHDALFHGLMIQVCAKLNILKYRLRSIPQMIEHKKSRESIAISEREEIRTCVRQHQEIHKFVKRSNEVFSIVMFIQFSVSAFVICMSTYMLSKMTMHSAGFTFLIVYVSCMIVQIFLLCWYGNEVITESMDVSNAIYDMDWNSLGSSTKKDLRLMMTRTNYRLQYTSGHVIVLSLDSYNRLMKLTYSMYNLLQQTSS